MVSVLFADLVGFTPFSEARDPEEVRAMLTRYFERSREIVGRFEGTVDKFIGDAVMAWWGAVEAQEDDAERAVRAALELVDMVANLGAEIGVPELSLRAGVLTGETSVGPGGNEQGLIVGDLVNTASRLQSIAAGGTVVIGASTAGLVASAIELQPLGDQVLKGKEIPVAAFRAVRVVAQRGGRGRTEGLEPPFTGRHDELRLLKDQLHATARDKRGRLVSVVGEGGIGKSRLAWELLKYIDGISDTVFWHQGRSPAYGEGIAFWSVAEMIRGRAGIVAESDDRAKARIKLRTAIAEYVPLEDERQWMEPRLAALVGLDEAPPGDRSELFAAIRTFFQRIAERSTVAMVFEDLHFADDGVLEFIDDLIERSTRHPILIITLARPELLAKHPGWGSGRNMIATHLAPLPDADMRDLVMGMTPGLPTETVDAIVNMAAGIPLYAVEFVRMLIAGGDVVREGDTFRLIAPIADLPVPDSLAAVIGARLDRLQPSDRELVQDAAVLGQSFTLNGLAAVRGADPAVVASLMRDLVRNEIFEFDEDPRSAERGQYRFVQGLIREVAYGRLSITDRHTRHRRVAEYFAGLGDAELAGIIASHFLAAHATAPAGSENLLEKGRTALVDAARRAASLQAHAQALVLFRQALELSTSAADRASTLLDAAEAATWAGEVDDAIDLGDRAIAAMEEAGDADGVQRAHTVVAFALDSFYRPHDAVARLRPVFDSIKTFDNESRAMLGLEMVRALMLTQQYDEAITVADRVLPRAERLAPTAKVIDGIISKATALGQSGRYLEAEAMLTGAVALADSNGLQAQTIRALNNLGSTVDALDPMAVARISEDLFERATRFASTAWLTRAKSDRVDVLISMGRYAEALAQIEELDGLHLPHPLDLGQITSRLVIEGHLQGSRDIGARIRAALDTWGEIGDPQIRDYAAMLRATSHVFDGDLTRAFDLQARVVTLPAGPAAALTTAIALRDRDSVSGALIAIRASIPARGKLGVALERYGTGALLVLGGNHDEGLELMTAALDAFGKILPPTELVGRQAAFAALVGLDHPAGFAAGSAAQEWLRSVGARGLERIYATGLPGDTSAAREVG
ncbi:MAG TPA: adenylate/guanylate cyclase domain-containing protein [Acidimicrobiia bacterium]|nr:adenylate/guanylate cyclase domain-containing protein [Acidimicrobiia bacterium]